LFFFNIHSQTISCIHPWRGIMSGTVIMTLRHCATWLQRH
jgi:hypothetical protein